MESGKYIYCIVEEETSQSFESRNIGNPQTTVYSVHYKDIGAVVSDSPIMKYPLISDNYLAHQRVIEESLFKNLTPLPVRFATIAKDEPSIHAILKKRYPEFKKNIELMRGKRELGLKAFWQQDTAYKEILQNNSQIKTLRDKLITLPPEKTHYQRIEIGNAVEKALNEKRNSEQREILELFKNLCIDYRTNRIIGDKMILNASFLVDQDQENYFDLEVQKFATANNDRLTIKYVGPIPPYNFVEIAINIDELGLN